MLLDTSGLLCYLHRDEPAHDRAVMHMDAARRMITHNYVLAEFIALATARRLPRNAVLSFIVDLCEHPDVEIIWVTHAIHAEAMALLNSQIDKNYSLCDAVSFILMRDCRVTQALTTDRHFEQAGYERLLATG